MNKSMEPRENVMRWETMRRSVGLQGRVCKYEDMTEDETGAKERGHIVNDLFYLPKLISRHVFIHVVLDI